MPRLHKNRLQILDAKAATGHSTVVNVKDYQHIVVGISAALNSSLTFKFKGSILDSGQTDITAAQAVDNIWDYVSAYDLEDPSSLLDGDTGVTLNNDTVANNTHQYLINTDLLDQFAIELTAYTDGSLTAWVVAVND